LIDALNVAYDYGLPQHELVDHMTSNELTLAPSQQHLKVQKDQIEQRASVRMNNILKARQDTSPLETDMPDHIKKFKTHQTIPAFFRQVLPPALAVSEDKSVADQVVNAGYER
jgi:hypothetical protein